MTHDRDEKGSKARCLKLTGLPRAEVARILTDLTGGNATVSPDDKWALRGAEHSNEASVHRLSPAFPLISSGQRKVLLEWWLHTHRGANTPNWDIVSSCTIERKPGLLLVEAKAHCGELAAGGKTPEGNADNHGRIGKAIEEADTRLNAIMPGWALTRDHSYQLANRFAWAWKFAEMGTPVVVAYLGFLKADDMTHRRIFATHGDWERCVREHADPFIPAQAWGARLDVNGAPLIPLIRSMEM